MRKIEICYPSFSKKAITFSIDDGNITYDAKFLSIMKPAGIKGTFNLCSDRTKEFSEDFYRNFYKGYEIANHAKYHPFVFYDGVEYKFSDEPFSKENADPELTYRVEGSDGFFWVMKPNGWRQVVSLEDFIRYVKESKDELNLLFGEGTVRDFVWPYGEQDNADAKKYVTEIHRSARKTGCTLGNAGFAIPDDKDAWSYNANQMNLLEVMKEYEEYPDDGGLKFFCFGVHSIDYERDSKWGDLSEFARLYGNRPNDFWYASVGEIFDYEEAVKMLEIRDSGIYNPSSLPIYIKIDGRKEKISPLGVVS